MDALNAAGLPNAGSILASFSHSTQPPLSVFSQVLGRVGHGAEARGVGHRRVLNDDNIVGTDGDCLALAVSPKLQAAHRALAIDVREVEVGDGPALDESHTVLFKPAFQGT